MSNEKSFAYEIDVYPSQVVKLQIYYKDELISGGFI